MVFFLITLGIILIWQKFSGTWESDFKRYAARREDYKMVENNGNYNALHEEARQIVLAENRSFTRPNTRANEEFERVFFEGDTETKEV